MPIYIATIWMTHDEGSIFRGAKAKFSGAGAKAMNVPKSILARLLWLLQRHFIEKAIQRRRKQLSREVDTMFEGTIAYGPFKGQKLAQGIQWGKRDRASMILGMYEQEVIESLASLPRRFRSFIDLGAADGYYGIGVLVKDWFDNAHCFEVSPRARGVIDETAGLNHVEDRMAIHGTATSDFHKEIPQADIRDCVVFIDIEGGEFDLCTQSFFRLFRNSVIFIEVHDLFYPDGERRKQILKSGAEEFFFVTELTTGARDPFRFAELDHYEDTDRWLICSEGRLKKMSWFRLDPKPANAVPLA